MDEGTASAAAAGQNGAQDISAMSFEQALAALEAIVQQLERGDVPLDQSISLYERGEALRGACQARLDAAQARIERIVTSAEGRPTGTRSFDGEG
ncbi:MAG: exodeoxyribonuclease VII small subunit [Erythrobacter sp.]